MLANAKSKEIVWLRTYIAVKQKIKAIVKPLATVFDDEPYAPDKPITSAMSKVMKRPVIQSVFLRPQLST